MQRFGFGAFDDRTPAVVVTKCLDGKDVAIAPHIEPEVAVKILRDRCIGYREDELIERVHTEGIRFGGRRDIAANSGHSLLPLLGRGDWPAYKPETRCEQLLRCPPLWARAYVAALQTTHSKTRKPGAGPGFR